MCGRYSLFVSPEKLSERFDVTVQNFQPRYNAAPGQSLPVITDDTPGELQSMEWGLIPPWAESRDDGGHINARAETLTEKPTFRDAVQQQTEGPQAVGRCLVPADGFYEWVDIDDRRQPYRVTLGTNDPFAMAGLWAEWQPPTTQTGLDAFTGGDGADSDPDIVRTFTIVTTTPNDLIERLHHRMAVMLTPDTEQRWLTEPTEAVGTLLQPYPDENMQAYPVSTAVNDPSNDSPVVTQPVDIDAEI